MELCPAESVSESVKVFVKVLVIHSFGLMIIPFQD